MTSLTALEAARTTYPTPPLVHLATLPLAATTLMASRSRIIYLRPLSQTLSTLHILRLPLLLHLQVNLLIPSSSYHILQRLTDGSAHKLLNVTPQHLMIPGLLLLLVHHILRNQKRPLLEHGCDLSHRLSSLAEILETPPPTTAP